MSKEFYFQWHITNLCNFRCLHCYQADFSQKDDLGWEDLKKVADNILAPLKKSQQSAVINLTGGEPFLKKELFDLVSYLNCQPQVKEIGIITNGSLLDKQTVSKLKAFKKLDEIKLSLEAADESSNDSIRGKGAFSKTLKAIELLKGLKNIEITLMFTILRRNFLEVGSVLEFAKEIGADGVILERFIPWGKGDAIKKEVLTREEWRVFLNRVSQFLEIPFGEETLQYKAFWVRFKSGKLRLLGAPCIVGEDGLCIMPNADCFPCRRFNLKIGNLLESTLSEIYNSSQLLRELRKKENLKGKCRACPIKSCRGCRALAFALTGDYLAEDVQCDYPPSPKS